MGEIKTKSRDNEIEYSKIARRIIVCERHGRILKKCEYGMNITKSPIRNRRNTRQHERNTSATGLSKKSRISGRKVIEIYTARCPKQRAIHLKVRIYPSTKII
tara:strand:+ start:356 stop:664 length:309 start_codon:yes stop_codon:yes gene_type:complete